MESIYPQYKYVDDDTMKMRLQYMKRDLKSYFDYCFFQGGKKLKMIKWMLSTFPNDFNMNEEVVNASSWSNLILCCYYLENYKQKIRNESRLEMIKNLKNNFFYWKNISCVSKNRIYFLKCCHLLCDDFNGVCEKFVRVYAKMYKRLEQKSISKIITWWIPICYDVKRECGKRMMERSWNRVEEMYKNLKV